MKTLQGNNGSVRASMTVSFGVADGTRLRSSSKCKKLPLRDLVSFLSPGTQRSTVPTRFVSFYKRRFTSRISRLQIGIVLRKNIVLHVLTQSWRSHINAVMKNRFALALASSKRFPLRSVSGNPLFQQCNISSFMRDALCYTDILFSRLY